MLINIEKISEDEDTVEYRFSSDLWMPRAGYKNRYDNVGRSSGTLCLNKHKGEIVLLEPMPEDINGDCRIRAEVAIRKHFEKGEFPDKTLFASG